MVVQAIAIICAIYGDISANLTSKSKITAFIKYDVTHTPTHFMYS